MQALIEFWPIAAFYIAYKVSGDNFQTAVMVIMVAMAVHVAGTWLIRRTVSKMTLFSAAMVEVLGAISLVLKNQLVFMWKVTVVNWLFAAVFLASHFIGGQPVVQRLLGSVAEGQLSLTDKDWRTLSLMWIAFFFVSGAANLYVAYNFPEHIWVNFKLYGLLGLTFVFIVVQSLWIARRDQSPAGGK